MAAAVATICLPVFLVAVVAAAAVAAKDNEFPLLMPKIHPSRVDDYICTPVRVAEDRTSYIVGFRPNSTHEIAHHMLIFGCEEPGLDSGDIWNCGEMADMGEDDSIVHTSVTSSRVRHFMHFLQQNVSHLCTCLSHTSWFFILYFFLSDDFR